MKILLKNTELIFQEHNKALELASFVVLTNSSILINYNNGTWATSTFGNVDIYKIDIPDNCTSIKLHNIGGSDAVSVEGIYCGTGCAALNSSDVVMDGQTSLREYLNGKAIQTYNVETDTLDITFPTGSKCISFNAYITHQYGNPSSEVSVEF